MIYLTIFIAGKITGDEKYKSKFHLAKFAIRELYPEAAIISPTDIELFNMEYEDCLDITKKIIEHCDLIIMLNDWQESNGAKIEHEYAQSLNKKIRYGVK